MDTAEVQRLVEQLHAILFGEVEHSVVDENLNINDEAKWIVERLRVLTDDDYAECAYGSDEA